MLGTISEDSPLDYHTWITSAVLGGQHFHLFYHSATFEQRISEINIRIGKKVANRVIGGQSLGVVSGKYVLPLKSTIKTK